MISDMLSTSMSRVISRYLIALVAIVLLVGCAARGDFKNAFDAAHHGNYSVYLEKLEKQAIAGDTGAIWWLWNFHLGFHRDAPAKDWTLANHERGLYWLRKQASMEQGMFETAPYLAQIRLGELYQHGRFVEKDLAKARHWYQKAVNTGQSDLFMDAEEAQNKLASLPLSSPTSTPIPDRQVSEDSDDDTMPSDSLLFSNASTAYQKGNYALAAKYFRSLAIEGDRRAEYFLAFMYETEQGVEKDFGLAADLYYSSAMKGYPDAQNRTGMLFMNGFHVFRDYSKAMEWFRKAASQGNPYAYNNIGVLYMNGNGVPVNTNEAIKYFNKSISLKGGPTPRKNLEHIRSIAAQRNTEQNDSSSSVFGEILGYVALGILFAAAGYYSGYSTTPSMPVFVPATPESVQAPSGKQRVYQYKGISGTQYKYDLSKPIDKIHYEIDYPAQIQDSINPSPLIELDQSMGQMGGGAKR